VQLRREVGEDRLEVARGLRDGIVGAVEKDRVLRAGRNGGEHIGDRQIEPFRQSEHRQVR
jgi:hypothetical protein